MRTKTAALAGTLLLAFAVCLRSQNITGTIAGTVRDPSQANLVGVKVIATHVDTSITFEAVTNSAGVYVLPLLPVGRFEVTAEAQGFKRFVRSGLRLEADQRLRVDIQMELGAVSEQVTVTSEAPVLKTEQATIGSNFMPSQIENLPVSRNVFAIMQVVPGVQTNQQGLASGNINGGRATTTDYELDGMPAVSANIGFVGAQPIMEMVEELVVQTGQYSAESGRGSAQVSLNTRPGTNEYHGTLFHFFRNDVLNANSFFNNARGSGKPKERYNLFGATFGGPVRIPRVYDGQNRTFFNLGYEGTRQRGYGQRISTVPTAAMRGGDFAGLATIYDPDTTRANPAGAGFLRTPFSANRIPSSRIDPISVNTINASWPLPTSDGLVNNYVREGATPTTVNRFNARGDHTMNDKNRLSLRYLRQRSDSTSLLKFAGPAGAGDNSTRLLTTGIVNAGSADHTLVITPNLLHNFRFSLYRGETIGDGPGTYEDWPNKLGIKNVPGDRFPVMNVTGVASIGGSNIQRGFESKNWFLNDNLTWITGKHSIKWGFEYRHLNFTVSRGSSSIFSFDLRPTMDPLTGRQGEGFASFLLGVPSSSQLDYWVPNGFDLRWNYYGAFMQDDFKLNRWLTLNLGFRWETTTPRTEVNNYQSTFDLATQTPRLAGRDGYPRTLRDTDWKNFQPRFGFALLPFGNESTVIRGGYGIFMLPTEVSGDQFTLGPWRKVQTYQTTDNGITYPLTFRSAMPLIQVDPSAPFTVNTGTSVNWMPRDFPNAYMQQWSLNIQRNLPGRTVVEAGYVGTRGLHLEMNVNLNQVPAHLLGPGNAQSRRPYPRVNAITTIRNGPFGASTYHGFQMRVERRFRSSFGFQAAYTLSKSIDNSSGVENWRNIGVTGLQDNYNFRAERSVSGFDITHNLGYNLIYSLPFGGGRRYLNEGGLLNAVLGGWNISTLGALRSGTPLLMGTQGNTTGSLGGGSRPNRTRDKPLPESQRSLLRWFDPSGFSLPAPFTFGNTSRTEPRLRAPGEIDLALMLAKEFPLREKAKLQLRGEFFNALNHFNPGNPNTTIGFRGVGQITGGSGGRTVQLSLRLYY